MSHENRHSVWKNNKFGLNIFSVLLEEIYNSYKNIINSESKKKCKEMKVNMKKTNS